MLTVFLLMPGLILLFPRELRRTGHRSLVPDISGWGRFLVKSKVLFALLFLLLLPFAFYGFLHVDYAFSDEGITPLVSSEDRIAKARIRETFSPNTAANICDMLQSAVSYGTGYGAGWYGTLPKSQVSPPELQLLHSSIPAAFACAASVRKYFPGPGNASE